MVHFLSFIFSSTMYTLCLPSECMELEASADMAALTLEDDEDDNSSPSTTLADFFGRLATEERRRGDLLFEWIYQHHADDSLAAALEHVQEVPVSAAAFDFNEVREKERVYFGRKYGLCSSAAGSKSFPLAFVTKKRRATKNLFFSFFLLEAKRKSFSFPSSAMQK